MCDGAVNILGRVIMPHDYHRHLAFEHGVQRLLSGHGPAVKAVDDGVVGTHDDGKRPAIGHDRLHQQFQILAVDLVGVVVIGLELLPVYPLQGG